MKSCPSCQAETDDRARFCLECGYAFESAAAEAADPWQGRMVAGRFRIIRKLGDGGMGEVFLAEQVPMGRSVALKVLRQSLSDDPEQVARFKREAQAASQLQHPNTIIVHDFGQDTDGTLFIAMEFLEGHPLDAVLEEQGTLEPERAARIMTQVCASLNEAHARGMVHRDLKPENIFLVDRGTPDFVKVLDFGIAKVTQSSKGEKLESITRAGAVFGTPHYMAPEQIRGEELDARADVYALGVVLYRMIAGHLPFEASTVMEMLTKHLTAEPAPIQRDGGRGEPEARARLEAVALRALCKQPDQRQPSALAFVEDIMAALPGITFNSITGLTPLAAGVGAPDIALPPVVEPVPARADAETGSSGGQGALIGLLILLLAGGAAAGWWFFGHKGGGPDGTGGAPAILAQGGGDEGGGEGGGDEQANGDEKADAGAQPAEGGEGGEEGGEGEAANGQGNDPKPAEGQAGEGGEAAGGEGGEVAGGEGGEATEGAAGEEIDEAEAKRIADEAAKAEAEAAKAKAAAEAEKARVAAEEQAKAAAAEKQAAEAAKARAESEKAEAEAARAKAEAEKAAAQEAAAAAEAKAQQAAAGRKKAEAAAALAKANRLKAEAAAARARAEAERLKAEMARMEAARATAQKAAQEAEAAREAAEAKARAAETERAEAAARRAAAQKGRRAAGFGMVKVVTRTSGAKVKIDGVAAGVTPTSPIKLEPGRHVIEIIKGDKRVSKTINVSAGKQTRVSFSL